MEERTESPTEDSTKSESITQWEYRFFIVVGGKVAHLNGKTYKTKVFQGYMGPKYQDYLTELGDEGWEAVGLAHSSQTMPDFDFGRDGVAFLFKRPKRQE